MDIAGSEDPTQEAAVASSFTWLGGRSPSSVSANTGYVVAGPGADSKLEEARERDIPVMDEEDFLGFVEERGVGVAL